MTARGFLAAAALAASIALPEAQAQTGNLLACVVHEVPEEGRLATCTGRVTPKKGEWSFVLRGRAPNVITRIEIYDADRENPRQVLDGFELRPRLVRGAGSLPGRVEFVLQDVNFDRLPDLRLAVGPAEGDGTAYRWFVFDGEADAFVPTGALDALRDPIFIAQRKMVSSAFKDERGRTGRIMYKWRDGKLDPVGAIARERTDDGRCIASHYVMREGKFEKRNETECRAGDDPGPE